MVVTAESCTGGGVATAITRISGSAKWFDRAFVTYSNTAKREMLGVTQRSLAQYGAVSKQVAREMARVSASVFASTVETSDSTGYARRSSTTIGCQSA